MKLDKQTYQLTEHGNFGTVALITGIVGLLLSAFGWYSDPDQFYFSYLVAIVFWVTIALGGLFFTMLNYLVDAKWSIVIRRFGESLISVFPVLALLFIPILFGLTDLFHWSRPELVANDHLLQEKSGYLNQTFFIIRLVIYFVIWIGLSYLLNKYSAQRDSDSSIGPLKKLRVVSAPGMILLALTLTFAAFDWLMSLDAHWYSTIFGVYIFSGSFLAMLAFTTYMIIRFQRQNILTDVISGEHFHDLGKLMFAFVIFWGYMAFSQYFLIWYGNIPEETIWFLHRWEGTWSTVSLILLFGHFVLPFFILFPQTPKRNRTMMTIMAIWIILMHWVDIYWIVMPILHHHGFHLTWIDLTTMLGIGGVFCYFFWRKLSSRSLIPIKDPYLEESKTFVS